MLTFQVMIPEEMTGKKGTSINAGLFSLTCGLKRFRRNKDAKNKGGSIIF